MRSEDEIKREREHIRKLQRIEIEHLLGGTRAGSMVEERARELLVDDYSEFSLWSQKLYEDSPKERRIFLQGLMYGRLQALEWVLRETEDLY